MSQDTPTLAASLIAMARDGLLATLTEFAQSMAFTQPEALEGMRNAALESFEELCGLRDRQGFEAARGLTASRISLVHEEDLEFSIRLSELARRLRERCEGELTKLHLRFMTLLQQTDAIQEQLPVGPETVCCGLRGLSDGAGLSPDERLNMLDKVEVALGNRMAVLYGKLNRALEAEGIAPRAAARPEPSPPARSGTINDFASAPVTGPLAQLHRAVMSRESSTGQQSAGLDPALTAAIMERVMGWLTEQQHAANPDNAAPGRLAGTELGPLLAPQARASVEAIERVFGIILDHPRLPAAAKAAMSRLQIPLLKLALVDPQLILDPNHPARRLLDAMAVSTTGLPIDTPANHPVCRTLDECAARIQSRFERDARLFGDELHVIESLLVRRQALAQSRITPFTQVAAKLEREEVSARFVSRAIRALVGSDTPPPVRSFLETHWLKVLIVTLGSHGDKSPEWRNQLMVADRLIWSVQPKANADERAQLVKLLPELMRRIHAGLALIGIDEATAQKLLNPCMGLHAAALHGRPPGEPDAPYAAPRNETTLDALPEVSGLRVLRQPGFIARETAAPEIVENLNNGDWIDVALPDGRRVRGTIGWIGPSRQIYLVVDPDRAGTLAITQRVLAQQWTSGHARKLTEPPLFEKAAEDALKTLRGNR